MQLAIKEGSVEMEFSLSLGLSCSYEHSKTLISSLKKWGFGEDRITAVYGENVEISLYVPCSSKPDIATSLEEMYSRGMLQKLEWGSSAVPTRRYKQ